MSDRVRILILEDDQDLRGELCDTLEEEGYLVSGAGRGSDALALAASTPFDLVVADVCMQGMDGLEALERMRAHQPDLPSMVITGYASEADSIRAIRLGVGDYLKKPFSRQEFLERVAALLGRRQQASAREEGSRALRNVAVWSLEALAGALDAREANGLGPRLRSGRLAGMLASALGLEASAGDDVRMAAMVACIRRRGDPGAVLGWEEHPALHRTLQGLEERWDGGGVPDGLAGAEIPLESRLVAVALEAADLDEPPQVAAERLRSQEAQRFDPMVIEALATVTTTAKADREVSARVRGLLSLGETLGARGDEESARRAFAQVVRDAPEAREAVTAQHRLAALAVAGGECQEAIAFATAALDAARRLGPVAAASAGLESALLLAGVAPERAVPWLDEAHRLAVDLRLSPVAARACLGRARLGLPVADVDTEAALAVLQQSENATDLAVSASWLLPWLMERQGRAAAPQQARVIQRLARECPAWLRHTVERGRLSARARAAAATVLGPVGGEVVNGLLHAFLADSEAEVRRAATVALQESAPQDAAPLLRVLSTGSLEVFRGEVRVDEAAWKTQKIKFLFAYLAAHAGRPVPEELLIETFWPGDADKGKRSLWGATSVIRRALEPEADSVRNKLVLRVGTGLQLDSALPLWHDAEEIEKSSAEARRLDADGRRVEARDRFRRLAGLYRGPYLEGCYLDFALERRDRLEQVVQAALLRLGEAAHEGGQHQEALEHALRLLEMDPCHQEAHLVAMRSWLACGRPEEALRQYERCVRVLQKELGMEPAIKLVEVYHRARLNLGR